MAQSGAGFNQNTRTALPESRRWSDLDQTSARIASRHFTSWRAPDASDQTSGSKQLHLSVSRILVENGPCAALRKHSARFLIRTGAVLRRPRLTTSLCLADRFAFESRDALNMSETVGEISCVCEVGPAQAGTGSDQNTRVAFL